MPIYFVYNLGNNMLIYYDELGKIHTVAEIAADVGDKLLSFTINTISNIEEISNYYVDTSTQKLAPKPQRPSLHHEFDYTTHTWVDARKIEDVKLVKIQYINEQRLLANQTSFTFNGKEVATDPLSRSDIDGVNGEVALTNQLPVTFPNIWKAMDNTYINIPDVATWTSFYKAMVSRGTENFIHAQELKLAVEQASTIQEVENITW